MTPLKKFSERWPQGLDELLKDLESKGFKPEVSEAAKKSASAHWHELSRPRSASLSEGGASFFTYLGRDSKAQVSNSWGLVFVDKKVAAKISPEVPMIAIEYPDAAVDFVARQVSEPEWFGASVKIPSHVQAEAGVVIGPDCSLGEGVILESGTRLGARVKVGRGTRIGANSRIGDDCEIGEDCLFTGSVSIGGPGFGFLVYPKAKARTQRLHLGRVVIGDRVRLGAFVAIDRGVFEDTLLDSDVAIDNIVQVAHNCAIGQGTTLCGFVGLTGSTTLGKNVTFGGLVFTKGHLKVGDNVTVAGWSGVIADVEPNQILKGYPVKPIQEALKKQVLTEKLPEFYERLKKLEKAIL